MHSSYLVYVHRKLSNGEIFYVGKGANIKRARAKSSRSILWKRIEAKHGRSVHIVASGLSNDDACELESLLISEIGRTNLANFTDGGEGTPGRTVTEKTRELVRSKNKGIPPSPEAIFKAVSKTRKPVATLCGKRFSSITEAAKSIYPDAYKTAKINISACCNGIRGMSTAYGLSFRFEIDGAVFNGNHLPKPESEPFIFNSDGEEFSSLQSAVDWCIARGYGSAKCANIISAYSGRLHSAYGTAWWIRGQNPKAYLHPSHRRLQTMNYQSVACQ